MVFEARSEAESEVAEALERELPHKHYEVLQSKEFIEHPDAGGFFEGEIDIVVFSPEDGILVIEVKGGGIEYNGRRKRWYSLDHLHLKHEIDDPFRQATRASRFFRDWLKKKGIKHKGREAIPVSHAVFFPDIRWGNKPIPSHARPELILDSSHLRRLRKVIPQLMRQFKRPYHRELTEWEIETIRTGLLYPMANVMPTLKSNIEREKARFVRITEDQKVILDYLAEQNQLAIRGFAGTGKTLLAAEKARRLYHKGLKVVMLCFNRPLCQDLRKALISFSDRVDVYTYHALCKDLCKEAGIAFTEPDEEKEARTFWDEETPLMMLDALKKTERRYDAIIVDEGQDFRKEWFEALKHALADPEKGYFYIFLDPNQCIYCEPADLPVPLATSILRRNCRNTKSIGELVETFGNVEMTYHPEAPVGEPPTFIAYKDEEDELVKVEATLQKLLTTDGLDPEDVVCLSTHSKAKSCFSGVEKIAGIAMTEELIVPDRRIRFSTLHRFKGLEANVVLLCDVRAESKTCQPEHLYVATSRARHRIFIFHEETWQPPDLDT